MQDISVRQLDMGRRVRDFIEPHAALFPANTRGGELRQAILNAVAAMETAGAQQEAAERARQEATKQKDAAIARLFELLRAMNRTARGMDKSRPGTAALFRMPRSRGDQVILNTARAFVSEGTPIITEFTGRGLPASFLNTFEATITEVLNLISQQDAARAQLTASTASIKLAGRQLIDAVREFSPIVRNTFADDPAMLAAWESVSHVERAPKRKQQSPPAS